MAGPQRLCNAPGLSSVPPDAGPRDGPSRMRIVIEGDHVLLDRRLYRLLRRRLKALVASELAPALRVRVQLRRWAPPGSVQCGLELMLAGQAALRTSARGAGAAEALAAALDNLEGWLGGGPARTMPACRRFPAASVPWDNTDDGSSHQG